MTMLDIGTQNMFEVWNYILTFTSLSVFAVFVVDMVGHNTKTITTIAFTWASIVGIVVGEVCLAFLNLSTFAMILVVACTGSIISSVIVALILQTKDPEVERRVRR